MRVLELSSARILAGFPLPKEWQTSLRKDSCAASGKERLLQRHANPEREGEEGPCCTSGNSHADPARPDVHGSTVLDFVYGEADEISILFKDSRKSRGEVPGILRPCLRMIGRSCSRQGNRCEYLNFSRIHLPRKMSRKSFGNENIFTDGAASVSNGLLQFLIEFGIDELCRHSLRWHSRKRPSSRSFADDCSKKQGLENGEFPTLYVWQRWLSTTLKKVFVLPEAKTSRPARRPVFRWLGLLPASFNRVVNKRKYHPWRTSSPGNPENQQENRLLSPSARKASTGTAIPCFHCCSRFAFSNGERIRRW